MALPLQEIFKPIIHDAVSLHTDSINLVELLRNISIFSGVDDQTLATIGAALRPVSFEKGQDVFKKGDMGTSMYIITRGRVCAHDGQGHTFVEMTDGQFFGEYALLDTEARSAFITALAPTQALKLNQTDFYEILGNNINVVKGLLRVFTKRLRVNNLLQEELAASNRKIQLQNEEILAQKEHIEEQNNELEEKNKKITSSINYAKRIQGVMLPSVEDLAKAMPEVFVLYKPRDIVSGDFYWYAHAHGKHYFAVSDCTGHGVPGALMSMTGAMLLNHVVKENGFEEPEDVLRELHEGLVNFLKAKESNVQDGMDIALCVIDPAAKQLYYAGAKQPLFYIDGGISYMIKPNKEPIGGSAYEGVRNYTKHVLPWLPTATYYMTSDGYLDQFNKEGKKFMRRHFRELLERIAHLSLQEQQRMLDETIESWKLDVEQTDDILVAGFRLW